MNDTHIKTLAQVHAFLEGTQTVTFSLPTKTERYGFIRRSLIRFRYHQLPGPDKGLLLSFMTHVSGYSRVRKLNNNSLKPLLNRTIRLHSGNPYSHYHNPEFGIIWLLEYTDESIGPLTALLRTGARHLSWQAVDIELQELLGEHAQRRLEDGRAGVVRNGYLPEREIQTGLGSVTIQIPKVRAKTGEPATFHSALVPP